MDKLTNLKLVRRFLFFSLICSSLFLQNVAKSAQINWFVTNKVDSSDRPIPTNDNFFSCSDRIYAMVTVNDLAQKVHSIAIDWIDPSGRQREYTVHKFQHSGHQQWMWAWLTLHPPRRGGALSLINPSFGMLAFVGVWTIKISINNKLLGKEKFEVLC